MISSTRSIKHRNEILFAFLDICLWNPTGGFWLVHSV